MKKQIITYSIYSCCLILSGTVIAQQNNATAQSNKKPLNQIEKVEKPKANTEYIFHCETFGNNLESTSQKQQVKPETTETMASANAEKKQPIIGGYLGLILFEPNFLNNSESQQNL